MAKGLTKRQELILEYILEYVAKEGYPPSIREIGRDFDIGSLRGVTVHLDALERKGYISRSNTPRSIKVVHPSYQPPPIQVAMLPLLGSIAAGVPIQAQGDVEETLPVPSHMVRNVEGAFLLRIRGDSMIDEGIHDRDLVVIRPTKEARHGDLVAAMLGDEATVKRLDRSGKVTRLMPANSRYQPIPVDREDSFIVGKVIGLIRDYEHSSF